MLRELREVLGTLALAGACELALVTLHGGPGGMQLTAAGWLDVTLPVAPRAAFLVPVGRLVVKLCS